jgi:hypothetical protein
MNKRNPLPMTWKKCAALMLFAVCMAGFANATFAADSSITSQNKTSKSSEEMLLWYRQPGVKWLDAMPIGDGYMGAMIFGRVQLNVGNPAMNDQPTDERLAAVRAGTPDPNLEALVFQFGRYILAASSRAGGQSANLQGIWNQDVVPPWGSNGTKIAAMIRNNHRRRGGILGASFSGVHSSAKCDRLGG